MREEIAAGESVGVGGEYGGAGVRNWCTISFQLRIPPDHDLLEGSRQDCIKGHWFLFGALLLSHSCFSLPALLPSPKEEINARENSFSSNAKCIIWLRANNVDKPSTKYSEGKGIIHAMRK